MQPRTTCRKNTTGNRKARCQAINSSSPFNKSRSHSLSLSFQTTTRARAASEKQEIHADGTHIHLLFPHRVMLHAPRAFAIAHNALSSSSSFQTTRARAASEIQDGTFVSDQMHHDPCHVGRGIARGRHASATFASTSSPDWLSNKYKKAKHQMITAMHMAHEKRGPPRPCCRIERLRRLICSHRSLCCSDRDLRRQSAIHAMGPAFAFCFPPSGRTLALRSRAPNL